jgi:hypothetical protein
VAARSDWSAELLTRGARWDQTRVTFDGLPLFDPVHGLGALSAVNADAVGAGFLMPGVRPASVGEGGAAVLDLRSRPGGGDGRLRGVGEFSLLSARAALDQVVGGGRGAVMVAGRRSFAGLLLPELVRNLDDDDPYHLSELVARADWQVGGGRRLEASALYERDVLGGVPNGVPGAAAPDGGPVGPGVGAAADDGRGALRGNTLGRVTLVSPHGRVEARHTAGASAYGGRLAPAGGLRTSAAYATASGDYAPADAPSGERAPWGAGWALVHQRAAVRGAPDAFAAATADLGDAAPGAASLTQVALWGERRLRPRPALLVEAGLRLEAGGPVVGAGAVRPAPRLAARWTRGETVVSAAAGRAWQYLQARAPGAGFAGETVTQPGTLWLLAGRARPALRTDLATAGVERWYGGGWHASAQAYARAAGGLLVPDPRPVPAPREALALAAEERARGLELGLRRVAGAWTGGAAYTVADARTTVRDAAWGTLRFPSASDRRHAVDVTAARRVTRALRVGGAYTFATGLPFTRELVPGTLVERSGGAEWLPPVRGRPGAERLGASGSLDLSADWTGTIGPARAGLFLQVHNVLRRVNPAGYGLSYGCGRECGGTRLVDLTREGLAGPFPVLGARLRF